MQQGWTGGGGSLTHLAGFAGAAPGGAQRGAALRLQRGSVDVDLAAAVLDGQPAGALHAVCGAMATTLEHARGRSARFAAEWSDFCMSHGEGPKPAAEQKRPS